MPDARECLGLQREAINSLLHEVGCLIPVGALLSDDEWVIIGAQGNATARAELPLRLAGRTLELNETWWFDAERDRLQPISYRYAIYPADATQADPLLRWELHPVQGGRSREIYGHSGFPHLHVGSSREHVPTGHVSLEAALRYAVSEGADVSEEDARRIVRLSLAAERAAGDWRDAG